VIIGCPHYPVLSGLLQLELGPDVVLVSSADETARDVYAELVRADALRGADAPPAHVFATTGDPTAFRHLAEQVLGLEVDHVERAVIGENAA
jgi:glutamate racemase